MNEIETTNMSKELEQFCDNLKRNGKYNMANDNLYELKSVDINGNVIDRKFGVNVVTNYGMLYYNKTTLGPDYHISVGTGTGTPTTADTELFNKLDWVNVRSNVNKVSLPLRYDATTGIISSTRQVLEAYFNYNITDVDSPTNITEFGMINYDNGSLTTHSLVYDEQGNPSFIIKNTNERLYVTVYFVTNFKEDLINDAWDNDCYAIIGDYNTDVSRVGTTSTFYRNIIWTDYNRGNSNALTGTNSTNPRVYTTTRETIVDENDDGNTIVNENTLIDIDIQGSDKSIAGFSLTQPKGYQASGFRITKRLKLQTPEQITLPYMLPYGSDAKSYSYLFGHNDPVAAPYTSRYMTGKYALMDHNMETLTTYNIETHEWDIPVPFSSPSNCDYCNYFDSPTRIYVNFNGNKYVSVYFNINLNLSILAFNYVEYPIYATDKYWDTSTYEIIPDVTNIPVGLRNKKYYITEANSVSLVPTTETHEVIPHKEAYSMRGTTLSHIPDRYSSLYVSEQCNWVISGANISFISEDDASIEYSYPILPVTTRMPLFYNTGDILIYWHSSKFNIIDTTTPSVQPVAENFFLNFDGVAVGTPMFTFTDYGHGYVVCQHLTTNKTVIIDLHGDTENNRPTQYLIENTKHCNAILCTKYCVYQRSDITDKHTFEIYNMETRTVVDTFSITHTTNAVLGIRAWSKFIYVAITGVRPVLYRMDDKSIATISTNIAETFFETKYLNDPPTLAVDECMVFEPLGDTIIVFSNDEPLNQLTINMRTAHVSGLNRIEFNGGIKILMTMQSQNTNSVMCDIGLCIGERLTSYYGLFNESNRMLLYYKNGFLRITGSTITWYPIEQSLLCRATGTTRTVQSMNNRKNIKQPFSFKTTNDPNLWSIT